MRAGLLRHRIVIQSSTESRDTIGGVTKTWTNDATLYGTVSPLNGRERFEAQQVTPGLSHKAWLRYERGVTDSLTPRKRLLAPMYWTTLASSINSTETTISIVSAAGLPLEGEYALRIENEFMTVTAGQGTTSQTVTRNVFGSAAASHASSGVVEHMSPINIGAVMNMEERDKTLQILGTEDV